MIIRHNKMKATALSLFATILSVCFLAILAEPIQAATTYQYDNLHRLTQIIRDDGTTIIYEYDELGNRISKTVTAPDPTVDSITPNTGSRNLNNLAIVVLGAHFDRHASLRLERAGEPNLTATNINVIDPTEIRANLDLTGKALGFWDVVVENQNGHIGRLVNGFEVISAIYTLNLDKQGNGMVLVNGTTQTLPWSGTFTEGTDVQLNAAPDIRWQFDNWTGDVTGSTNPATVHMDSDKAVTAHFSQYLFAVSINCSGCGGIKVNGVDVACPYSADHTVGTSVTVEALPCACWHFSGWSGTIGGGANPLTFTIDSDEAITANFAQTFYSLTTHVNGSGSVQPHDGSYLCGATVELTATPLPCRRFDHWEGGLTGNVNPSNILMDENKTVTAVFMRPAYTLTTGIAGEGQIEVNPPGSVFDCGTEVCITPTPAACWSFDHWEDFSGNPLGSDAPLCVTMDSNKTIRAVFVRIPYKLTIEVVGNGSVIPNPLGGPPDGNTYDCGTNVLLTPIPDTCWHFVRWEIDLTGSDNPGTITMSGDKTVRAIFEPDQFTVTTQVIGCESSVTLDPPGGVYNCGTSVQVRAVETDCCAFDHWEDDLYGVPENPATIIVDGNKVVTAVFARTPVTLTPRIVGNGSVTVEPAGPNYDCGIEVCLTPTPAACWRFDHWEDGAGTSLGSAVPFCMTMDGNKTIGPVFVRTQHNIYITIIGAGHVTPPGGPYDCGTQVDLLAIPDDPCWQFHHWEGDITGTENPVRVIVNHDMHVIAVFVDISITYCRDADTDEYGNPIDSVLDCVAPSGYVDDCTDCDDTNPAVNPGEVETFCNCIDDDCEPATPDNGGCCPDFGIVLESGYSPVGPALHLCGALAEDLCNELNSGGSVCDRVIRYNVSTGMYATHICGLTFNNFSTEDGEGFFLRCSGEVTWWQEGCDIACPIAIELVPGYNPIALPACASTATAEGLCQAIRDAGGSADRVIRYRTETGMYDTHICGLPFNNFALEPGALYFVRSQTTATVLIP